MHVSDFDQHIPYFLKQQMMIVKVEARMTIDFTNEGGGWQQW